MARQFRGVPVASAAGGLATVHVFEGPSPGTWIGEVACDLDQARDLVEVLRLGSGLAEIFESEGV